MTLTGLSVVMQRISQTFGPQNETRQVIDSRVDNALSHLYTLHPIRQRIKRAIRLFGMVPRLASSRH